MTPNWHELLGPGRFPLPGGHVHNYEHVIITRPFLGRGRGMLDFTEMADGYRCACGARSMVRGREREWDDAVDLVRQALAAVRERYGHRGKAWETYRGRDAQKRYRLRSSGRTDDEPARCLYAPGIEPKVPTHWLRGIKAYGGPPPRALRVVLWWPASDLRPTVDWWR